MNDLFYKYTSLVFIICSLLFWTSCKRGDSVEKAMNTSDDTAIVQIKLDTGDNDSSTSQKSTGGTGITVSEVGSIPSEKQVELKIVGIFNDGSERYLTHEEMSLVTWESDQNSSITFTADSENANKVNWNGVGTTNLKGTLNSSSLTYGQVIKAEKTVIITQPKLVSMSLVSDQTDQHNCSYAKDSTTDRSIYTSAGCLQQFKAYAVYDNNKSVDITGHDDVTLTISKNDGDVSSVYADFIESALTYYETNPRPGWYSDLSNYLSAHPEYKKKPGLVLGKESGTFNISASYKEGETTVAANLSERGVIPMRLKDISLKVNWVNPNTNITTTYDPISPKKYILYENTSLYLVATGIYENGSEEDVTGLMAWSSSDDQKAKFSTSHDGKFENSTSRGEVVLTGKDIDSGISRSIQVDVKEESISKIEIITDRDVGETTPAFDQNSSGQLWLEASFNNDAFLTSAEKSERYADLTKNSDWKFTGSIIKTQAYSNSDGRIHFTTDLLPAGVTNVDIEVSAEFKPDYKFQNPINTESIRVSESRTLSKIIVVPSVTSAVQNGDPIQFEAIGIYSDKKSETLPSGITWSITRNGSAGTITSDGGLLTFNKSCGSCDSMTVSASTTSETPLTSTSTVSLSPQTLREMTITPDNASILAGQSIQFKALGTYNNNKTGVLSPSSVNWSAESGTIDANGLYQSTTPGTITITGKSGAITDTASVTIDPLPTVSISSPANLAEGSSGVLTFTLSKSISRDVTVPFQTTISSGIDSGDLTIAVNYIVMPAGSTSQTIAIAANTDLLYEADEIATFSIVSNALVNATAGSPSSSNTTIKDGDTSLGISFGSETPSSVMEDAGTFLVTLKLDAVLGRSIVVSLTKSGAGSVYLDLPVEDAKNQITIPAGVNSYSFIVSVNNSDNGKKESDKAAVITATYKTNIQHNITIKDNDVLSLKGTDKGGGSYEITCNTDDELTFTIKNWNFTPSAETVDERCPLVLSGGTKAVSGVYVCAREKSGDPESSCLPPFNVSGP